jgi:hypothetical protein
VKKIFQTGIIVCLSLFIFPGASVWEGAAEIGTDFPESGHFIATNAFPPNTLADITNLENGTTIRVIVSGGLEGSALLALLSPETARALGLENQSLERVRMVQSSDLLAASGFGLDRDLVLVPSQPKPPEEAGPSPDPVYIISSIETPPVRVESAPVQTETVRPRIYSHSPFSVPMVRELEPEKYYLQIAAFSKVEAVENERNKIDENLPVLVMGAGTEREPIYRVLIGPLNLGESGALLHRFRVSHKDAFVRTGP